MKANSCPSFSSFTEYCLNKRMTLVKWYLPISCILQFSSKWETLLWDVPVWSFDLPLADPFVDFHKWYKLDEIYVVDFVRLYLEKVIEFLLLHVLRWCIRDCWFVWSIAEINLSWCTCTLTVLDWIEEGHVFRWKIAGAIVSEVRSLLILYGTRLH